MDSLRNGVHAGQMIENSRISFPGFRFSCFTFRFSCLIFRFSCLIFRFSCLTFSFFVFRASHFRFSFLVPWFSLHNQLLDVIFQGEEGSRKMCCA